MPRNRSIGAPIAHVAAAMGFSRCCASKWWHRYLEFGPGGLVDRSSRPATSPTNRRYGASTVDFFDDQLDIDAEVN